MTRLRTRFHDRHGQPYRRASRYIAITAFQIPYAELTSFRLRLCCAHEYVFIESSPIAIAVDNVRA